MKKPTDQSAWEGFFSFVPTKVFQWLINCPCKVICLFTGNQFGKNETVGMDYILRVMGQHPNPHKNVKAEDKIRIFRFASQTLPGEKQEDEVSNTQYPVIKRRLPGYMIAKDIATRRSVMTLNTDSGKCQIEFVSFGQEVQAGAGVQRRSVWIDEESNRDFYEEQIPRLLAADGDIIFSFTPVPGAIGWEYDELYERARMIYRTDAVRKRIKDRTGEEFPEIEYTDSPDDIAVIMAATDDNPIYEQLAAEKSKRLGREITAEEYLDIEFSKYSDEDVIDARRYGLFRQLSGKIYKVFLANTHLVDMDKLFPDGIPSAWKFVRGIDYHEANPWAVVWAAVSPQDEIFIFRDWAPNPQRMITYDIALQMAHMSGDHRYMLDLIDPLANTKQVNTNLTTVEDLNRYMFEFKREGICTGGYFRAWDTKGTRGREEFQRRLANSIKVGKPFNNKVIKDDRTVQLPTIWIDHSCRNTIEAMKNWRMEDWKSREMLMANDAKEKPQTKWSHFPITIECLLKNPMVSKPRFDIIASPQRPKRYMSGRR